MIFQPFINLITELLSDFSSLLGTVNVNFNNGIFAGLNIIFKYVAYLIPISALIPIFVVDFALTSFKTFMALIVRIKSFIPTMGA